MENKDLETNQIISEDNFSEVKKLIALLQDTKDVETIKYIKRINTGYQGSLDLLLSKLPPTK